MDVSDQGIRNLEAEQDAQSAQTCFSVHCHLYSPVHGRYAKNNNDTTNEKLK